MRATLTSIGQMTLPVAIRRRLGLKQGDVLEFDQRAPFIKAWKPFERAAMRRAIGRGKNRAGKRPAADWIEDLRGPVELP